jgi:flavin-dependent dehydrogenase
MVANPYDRGVERFDALVVGAGPAGSAARSTSRAGASVLLVDKAVSARQAVRRGLTGRALRHLPCAVDPVVEHVVDRLVVRAGFGRKVARTGDGGSST